MRLGLLDQRLGGEEPPGQRLGGAVDGAGNRHGEDGEHEGTDAHGPDGRASAQARGHRGGDDQTGGEEDEPADRRRGQRAVVAVALVGGRAGQRDQHEQQGGGGDDDERPAGPTQIVTVTDDQHGDRQTRECGDHDGGRVGGAEVGGGEDRVEEDRLGQLAGAQSHPVHLTGGRARGTVDLADVAAVRGQRLVQRRPPRDGTHDDGEDH